MRVSFWEWDTLSKFGNLGELEGNFLKFRGLKNAEAGEFIWDKSERVPFSLEPNTFIIF